MTNFFLWVSPPAKFLPSACGSFTSEVTLFDDQAFLMTATTPRSLKRVVTNTSETVTSVFWAHGFNIKSKQGKTELVVNCQASSRSKGKYRAEIQERHNTFPLPVHAAARVVHAVPRYKHLGSIIDNDHRCNADTLARVHIAMRACSPIAITVLGNPKFSLHVRLLLARSLVFSRLFQGTRPCQWLCWFFWLLWALAFFLASPLVICWFFFPGNSPRATAVVFLLWGGAAFPLWVVLPSPPCGWRCFPPSSYF